MKTKTKVDFNPCIIIPIYNHKETIPKAINCLKKFNIPCFIVNDGNNSETVSVLDDISNNHSWVEVIHFPTNRGKGAAVCFGQTHAFQQGYTHALQVDADCQHTFADIPKFIDRARKHPEALVMGHAIFSDSVPKVRYYGRYVTHFFVWIETLSFAIKDSMCGFRVYPLRFTVKLASSGKIGNRMDFDTDMAVRVYWEGVPVSNIDTVVNYFPEGISNFRMIGDNLLIFKMHTRLVFGMLLRIPKLFSRKNSVIKNE